MKLDEEAQVLENLESGYLWQKSGFLPNENIGDAFKNLQELENSLQEDTKLTLTYIVRYTYCKGERINNIFFIMGNMVVF